MRRVSTMWVGLTLVLTLNVSPAGAMDRSVTILEGVDEAAVPTETVPRNTPAAMPVALITQNPAGVALAIRPGSDLPLGTRIAFDVSTQRSGYLVIVDINADGRIAQIFPNVTSLSQTSGDVASANLIRPGPAVTVPNKSPLACFNFTADEPRGSGAIVAMLSDRPVQLIDLPDIPPLAGGLQATVDALDTAVAGLKIASAGDANAFAQSAWSFVAVPYTIR